MRERRVQLHKVSLRDRVSKLHQNGVDVATVPVNRQQHMATGQRRRRPVTILVGMPPYSMRQNGPLSYLLHRASFSLVLLISLLTLVGLTPTADGGKFHGYKKVFHREEHGDHKTYYDDLHHGTYKKSATDSREMFRKENKDEQGRAYSRSIQGGNSISETVNNPVVVDAEGRNVSDRRPPVENENPRARLWQDPADFSLMFSSSFQDFMASLNASAF
ncbi:hypothetical protein BIW11_09856 [Tropilaelaps mercedesae]|uniref:Uncharacterized protein n=1 Tax=Tropilaelaps mercedesae TaxID=418985 RepID=A0A1V9XI66_9ACAR|nr:hypothetical protein BIW11_09856 [Tropilaelaps mercedesae]